MGKSVVDHFTARLRLDLAAETWGAHPWGWPRPPATRPPWLAFRARRNLAAMERVFGPLDAAALARFHTQARTGQSAYEDCGGYLMRCYRAMLGLPVEPPYTYTQAVADLMEGGSHDRT